MTIKDILQRWKDRKEQFKTEDAHDRHIYLREQRKITPEERELNRYLEEKRQDKIKERVKKIRSERNTEALFSNKHNLLYAKNIMVGHKKIFSNDKNIFKGGKKR
jgi:hypothetical protein